MELQDNTTDGRHAESSFRQLLPIGLGLIIVALTRNRRNHHAGTIQARNDIAPPLASPDDTTRAVEKGPSSEAWRAVAVEEYKTLRQESLTAIQNQHSTVRYSLTTIGILFGFAFNQVGSRWEDLIFLLAIPGFAVLSYGVYAIEFTRMVRVGQYIASIEETFSEAYGVRAANWETWLNTPLRMRPPRLKFYIVIPGIYFGAAFLSTAILVWSKCFTQAACSYWEWGRIGFVLFLWLLLIGLMSIQLKRSDKEYARYCV